MRDLYYLLDCMTFLCRSSLVSLEGDGGKGGGRRLFLMYFLVLVLGYLFIYLCVCRFLCCMTQVSGPEFLQQVYNRMML